MFSEGNVLYIAQETFLSPSKTSHTTWSKLVVILVVTNTVLSILWGVLQWTENFSSFASPKYLLKALQDIEAQSPQNCNGARWKYREKSYNKNDVGLLRIISYNRWRRSYILFLSFPSLLTLTHLGTRIFGKVKQMPLRRSCVVKIVWDHRWSRISFEQAYTVYIFMVKEKCRGPGICFEVNLLIRKSSSLGEWPVFSGCLSYFQNVFRGIKAETL